MTQADSVHSTPPTNTSANNIVDPSRRGFLAQAAVVAAGGAALGMALPLPQSASALQGISDPISALIVTNAAALPADDGALLKLEEQFFEQHELASAYNGEMERLVPRHRGFDWLGGHFQDG